MCSGPPLGVKTSLGPPGQILDPPLDSSVPQTAALSADAAQPEITNQSSNKIRQSCYCG